VDRGLIEEKELGTYVFRTINLHIAEGFLE